MTISVTPPANFGTNIYPGELVMMKGNTIAPGENGTYQVQNSTGSTIVVTVPKGTLSCQPPSGTCGTLYLGTPILGFGPGGGKPYNSYGTGCQNAQGQGVCSAFGMHIKNLGFNCQGAGTVPNGDIEGCIGWQNLYAQEESGADTFIIDNYNFVGFDTHGVNAQNFGPISNAEILTGGSNTNCAAGTTGAFIGGMAMRGFDNWTINSPVPTGMTSSTQCGGSSSPITPIAAVLLDAADTEVRHGHCENFGDCVLVGANDPSASGMHVAGITEAKPVTNDVEISANNSVTDFEVENIQTYKGNGTPTVKDDINNITLTNPYLTLYSWSKNSTFTNLVTTDTTIPNRFPSGVATGVSGNTDLAGQCTLGSSTCGNGGGTNQYKFAGSYTNAPICTCNDTSSSTGACVEGVSPTTITFTGTSGHVIDYVCVSRN